MSVSGYSCPTSSVLPHFRKKVGLATANYHALVGLGGSQLEFVVPVVRGLQGAAVLGVGGPFAHVAHELHDLVVRDLRAGRRMVLRLCESMCEEVCETKKGVRGGPCAHIVHAHTDSTTCLARDP